MRDDALKAFNKWKKISRVHRAEYFYNLAQLMRRDHARLVEVISRETGKNVNESHAEVLEAMHMCQVAAASGKQSFSDHLIGPANPVQLSLSESARTGCQDALLICPYQQARAVAETKSSWTRSRQGP